MPESLKSLLSAKPENTYGVVESRRDSKFYILKVGGYYVAAQWTGEALVAGDTVLINRTKLGTMITAKLMNPGDVTPEVQEIDP